MKKRLSILLAVFAAMAIFVSNVLAAPAEAKRIKLVSVIYNPGGIVLKFETSGLTKDDLKNNFFFADSNEQNMYCNFVDDSTVVRCVVSKALAGQGEFHGTLAGFGFSGKLPEARSFSCPDGQVPWYSVDGYNNGVYFASGNVPVWYWNWYAAQGYFASDAEKGITYQITGSFCAPDATPPV